MSSTPKPHPAVQRLNKAYVQVPPSPISLSSYRALGTPTHVVASSRQKENTPLRPFQLVMAQHASSSSSSAFLKRKMSDREPSSFLFDGVVIPSIKKSRLSASITNATPSKVKSSKSALPSAKACPEFPNGYAYCHQCNKKRDVTSILRCTVVEKYQTMKDKTKKERLCVNKYCKPCLKNRYNEDIEVLRSQTPRKMSASNFKCPRCMGICNCPRCRKSQGLEAIGVLVKPKVKESSSVTKAKKQSKEEAASVKAKEVVQPKLKALPTLKWTPVPVKLTQDQADERILIREFVLRFSDSLDPVIAKTHLDELEHIGGAPRKQEDEDNTTGWVSEACVKAVIMGLLGLLAKDHDTKISKMIKAAIKDLRSAGVNLNKIWATMTVLREDIANASSSETSTTNSKLSDMEIPLAFPNPLPPPVSTVANARSLRSLRQSEDSINIVNSTQMMPVLVSIIHSVLETAIIREDIDQSMKDSRDFARDAKEATKLENERWEKVRIGMENAQKDKVQKNENKVKRTTHKDQILNIDNSLKIVSKSFVPRFMALGTDDDGRTYYALSPGAAEREAAFEYLEVASSEKPMKPKKKSRVLSLDDRREMREWSWFVAVWGKRPPRSTEEQAFLDQKMETEGSDAESEDEDDMDVEKWWGFWEPEEISKVAEWISVKSGLEDDNDTLSLQPGSSSTARSKPVNTAREKINISPRQEQLKRLVTELKDYASLLEWRMREDKCILVSRFPANLQVTRSEQVDTDTKGKSSLSTLGPIPVERFYH